jgi:DNA-binding response OmpR family regulator
VYMSADENERIKNKKILIIEDDEDLCEEIAESFEDEGYSVHYECNGFTGKEELEKNSYNFLILDIKIPGMNGFDILRWLKATRIEITIIVLTGMPLHEKISQSENESHSEERRLLNYAYTVINKPFPIDVLLKIMEKINS